MVMIVLNYISNLIEIFRGKSKVFTKSDRIQPKFTYFFLFLYMYMYRLVTIKTVEEKTIFALKSFNCGHGEYTVEFIVDF